MKKANNHAYVFTQMKIKKNFIQRGAILHPKQNKLNTCFYINTSE